MVGDDCGSQIFAEGGKNMALCLFYMILVKLIWECVFLLQASGKPQDLSCQPSGHSEDALVPHEQSDAYSGTPSSSDNDTEASSLEYGTERSKPWYVEPKIIDETAVTLDGDILYSEDDYIHDWWQCNEKIIALRNPFVAHGGPREPVVQSIFLKWTALQVYNWAIELQFNLENFLRAQESGLIGIDNLCNILGELQVCADEFQGKHTPTYCGQRASIDSWLSAIQQYQNEVREGLPRPLEKYERITMRVQEMLRDMDYHHLKYRNSAFRKELFRSLEKLFELHETMKVSHRQCNLGFQMACKAFDNEMTLANRWLADVAQWRKNACWDLISRKLVKLDNFVDRLRHI